MKQYVVLCFVLVACLDPKARVAEPDPAPAPQQTSEWHASDGSSNVDVNSSTGSGGDSPATTQCLADGSACYLDPAACCGDLFCQYSTSSYGLAFCAAPQPNGAYCWSGEQCASGHCTGNGACGNCVATGGSGCTWDGDCCGGFCDPTDSEPVSDGICKPLLATGAACLYDGQCTTGACIDGVCWDGCVATGTFWHCNAGGLSCCEGICHDGGYGYGTCGPRKASGEWCWYDDECVSQFCNMGFCE